MPLQILRGSNNTTKQAWLDAGNSLANGELLWIRDEGTLWIGNGTDPGGVLITTASSPISLSDVADAFVNGTHSSITFTWDEENSTVDAAVDLSEYTGTITASGYLGDIIPSVDGESNLGSSDAAFGKLYVTDLGIQIGDAEITGSGTTVDIPSGSTIGGSPIASEFVPGSLVNISITDDGSTLLVDSSTGNFYGTFNGPVVADDSTVLVDANSNTFSTGETILSGTLIKTNSSPLELEGNIESLTQLQVRCNMYAASTINGEILSASTDWKFVELFAYKNSKETPGDIESGDVLGVIGIGGLQGSTDTSVNGVFGVQCDPLGTTTGTHIPTKFFIVNQPAVEGNETPHLTFDSLGQLAVNQENALATVDINGFMRLVPQEDEPYLGDDSSIPEGIVAIADGVNWDPLLTGKPTMVVRLGGDWVQVAVAA